MVTSYLFAHIFKIRYLEGFEREGLAGLVERERSGRSRRLIKEQVAQIGAAFEEDSEGLSA